MRWPSRFRSIRRRACIDRFPGYSYLAARSGRPAGLGCPESRRVVSSPASFGVPMLKHLALAAMLALSPLAAGAQSAAEHVAMGDRDHAALNASSALTHYEAALAAEPTHGAALWKASLEAVDLGEAAKDEAQRRTLYAKAEGYARRAVAASPAEADAHFALSRALGRAAL